MTTETKENKQVYDVGRMIMSKLIQKNSTIIEIEVLDNNENGKFQRLLLTSGTVDSFIQSPTRCSESGIVPYGIVEGNCLEIDVIWQDEREETAPPISERDNNRRRQRQLRNQSKNPQHQLKQDRH